MRWRGNRRSNNIEDRRGHSGMSGRSGASGAGGLLRLLPMAYRFLGFKGTAILVAVVGGYGLFSGNLGVMLNAVGVGGAANPVSPASGTGIVRESQAEKELADFVSVILADTEDVWTTLFRQQGQHYRQPSLVLFRDATPSACGTGKAAMGPFYCPADQKVFIDLSFFDQLQTRFSAPGDFAQAYVIAHEVGHHIQTLDGTSAKVHGARRKLSKVDGNKLSVMQELQADCLAGVWAFHANKARQLLEEGDVEEGLRAASAIGDDTLQKQSKGFASPDSFTHGSSAQRVKWFKIGLTTGKRENCDTFNGILAKL